MEHVFTLPDTASFGGVLSTQEVMLLCQNACLQHRIADCLDRSIVWLLVLCWEKVYLKVLNQFDYLLVSFQINLAKNRTYLVSTATC